MRGKEDAQTRVEVVRAKLLLELHEVATNKRDLALQARLFCVLARALDLELVVVEPNDLHVGETRYRPRRPAHSTPNIENTHAGPQAHLSSEIMLVARQSGSECLALEESAEVEGVCPAVLVKLSSTVIVTFQRKNQH